MLATPTERPPSGPGWRHEVKWDGIRAVVTVAEGVVSIHTRSGNDCSARFPELTASHLRDFDDLVLDGEIVSLVDGRPDFTRVMHRLSPGGFRGSSRRGPGSGPGRSEPTSTPVQLVAFDVLRAAGHDVTAMPWQARRDLLTGAGVAGDAVLVPDVHHDGAALFAATAERGLEGVVSKRVDAPYRPGIRSEDWLKSVHRRVDTFVVGGWRPVSGSAGTVGALLLGDLHEGRLRFRGRVGTGISRAAGQTLLDVLVPAPACPFVDLDDHVPEEDRTGTHWVRPNVAVDISYLQHGDGGRLRQPSYKGLRLDIGVPNG